jgi:hypothetical protein
MKNVKKVYSKGRIMNRGAVLLLTALAIVLVGCSDCEVKISTGTLPPGTVGQPYDIRLEESEDNCSGGEPEWRIIGGNLPPGLSLTNGGRLSGMPTMSGLFTFTVEVVVGDSDITSDTDSASKGFLLTIN